MTKESIQDYSPRHTQYPQHAFVMVQPQHHGQASNFMAQSVPPVFVPVQNAPSSLWWNRPGPQPFQRNESVDYYNHPGEGGIDNLMRKRK